jgi:hypothetical protein
MAYRIDTSLFETGLFQNAVESSERNIIARLSSHRNPTQLDRMLELTVASLGGDDLPTVIAEKA